MTTINATETRTCATHGPYEATPHQHLRGVWTLCPACQRERDERELRRHEENAQRELAERKRELMFRSGIVGRYLTASFDSFDAATKQQKSVLLACRAFAANFHRDQGAGLWLIGPPGTGKTHLGSAIASAVIEEHARGAWVTSAREIVRRLRDTWRRDAEESEADVIAEYGSVSLLILDEVGAGFGTEGEQVQLFDVLDRRYTLQRPTVLLSNLTPAQLKTTLGDRTYDRLREGAKVLVCDWPSHRGATPC